MERFFGSVPENVDDHLISNGMLENSNGLNVMLSLNSKLDR